MLRTPLTLMTAFFLAGCTAVAPIAAPFSPVPTPSPVTISGDGTFVMEEYAVPAGSHPHDVAPAADGTVWYTAQLRGELGRLDPATGATHRISLGAGSAPHGVI